MIIAEEITADQLYKELMNIKDDHQTNIYSLADCQEIVPVINEINLLKKTKNACILAHSYCTPDIVFGVSDFVGDSYELSKKAKETDADTIIFAGVRFMGETAKLLSPQKNVIVPASDPGCTLADAITGAEVLKLKEENPDFTFVCYINTTAEVKAACDVCVTSANIYKVVQRIDNDKIFFVPDRLMALNLIQYCQENNINKTIKYVNGTCYVHEEYQPESIDKMKAREPKIKVLCHPECDPRVCNKCDFVGSTSQILNFVKNDDSDKYMILTDNGISARVQHDYPNKQIIGDALACKYMKSNNLPAILKALKNPSDEDYIQISSDVREKALSCINAMFRYTE